MMTFIFIVFCIALILSCIGDSGSSSTTTYSKNIWGEKVVTTKSKNKYTKKVHSTNLFGGKVVKTQSKKRCYSCGRMVNSSSGSYSCCGRTFR